jgi:3-deoxy-manno-octulosonate cytidylyltransferase (CMP-KDO synthetase)
LELFSTLPESTLEKAEKLEQLRLMQAGAKYKCVETDIDLMSIDTREDLVRINDFLK